MTETAKKFVNLHTHSFFSILGANMSTKDILAKAGELGSPAVALTDTGVGYGLIDFYQSAQKSDVKPILGAEIFVSKDSRFERRAGVDGREGYLVLLAQNEKGFHNLIEILSAAALDGFYHHPRADWETLEKFSEGLIVLTGATGGLVGKTLQNFGPDKAEEVFVKTREVFGAENVFVEIVSRTFEVQQNLNKFCVGLLEKYSAQPVVTSDARYTIPEDEEAVDTLMCIARNQQVDDPSRMKMAEKNWFKSWEEMESELTYIAPDILEQARENTLSIAANINFEVQFGQDLLPHFEVGAGETDASQLRKNCESKIEFFYGDEFKKNSEYRKTVDDRLDYELSIIGKMGFDAYFLIVQDFIQFAKKSGISVGPGRGSAAGSLVSYLLGITTIDPLKYDLLFERFLNPERISMPDVDIDFSDERRDEVLQYVIEKYGIEKVSKVCTFGTLSAKAALKDVGRAQGVAFGEMNAFTKLLPNKPGFKLKDALDIADFKTLIGSKSHLNKVYEVATKLEGCVRHVSVHACAVIIGPDDLRKHVPLQWAPGAEKVKITQLQYQELEAIGLLKMDFLGLKNLSILEKAVAHIKNTTGEEIDLPTIPIDDQKTFEMFSRGETTGVFQFESAGMRRYMRELQPTEFEDLVAMNALYRPGPMEYIPTYIDGKHGKKKVKYLDKTLEPILEKTYGIAVYQEQIMKIAQVFAGFTLGGADILRKAIGKKKMDLLAEQRKKFIEGAIQHGHQEKTAVKMFDDIIVPFAGYGFNRSHAVCYARIAYETAYLRANYPVEFMAAMMTTDRNNTDRIVLEMNECQEMGIEVLPPSVNESGAHFTVIQEEQDKEQLKIEEGESTETMKKIRFGLSAIKGMGEETVDQIIFERKNNGAFESLQDFAKRVPAKLVNKKTLEALAFSGAFDAFGDRKAIVESLEDLAHFAKEHHEKAEAGQMGLFGGSDESAVEFTLKSAVATKDDILKWERESLGMFVSDHPLKGLGNYFEKFGKLIGKLTEEEDDGKVRTLHGLVISARKITTKAGKNMAILTLEDTSGKIEVAIFPMAYDKVPKSALEVDAFIRVKGKVNERDGVLNIIADAIKVGNLKQVQETHAMSEEDTLENEEVFEKGEAKKEHKKDEMPFVVNIPAGTTKQQVDLLKKLLFENKSETDESVSVKVVIDGRTLDLPFKICVQKNLSSKIQEILK